MSLFWIPGLLILTALYLRWVSPVYVLRRLGARPFSQGAVMRNVRARLEMIARRQRKPFPRLWVLPEFTPNALILRSRPGCLHIALTEGMLRALSGEELDCALELCLTHGYQRGRMAQTWVGMFFFPITRLVQSHPLPAQLLLSPILSLLFRVTVRSGQFVKADREAAKQGTVLLVAATLQKLSVMGVKIPLRNWNVALDSLFLVSPLSLDEGPFWVFLAQPSVERRRHLLLASLACESSPSLT